MATPMVPFAHTSEANSSEALSETGQVQASTHLVDTKVVPFVEDLVYSKSHEGLTSVELNKTNLVVDEDLLLALTDLSVQNVLEERLGQIDLKMTKTIDKDDHEFSVITISWEKEKDHLDQEHEEEKEEGLQSPIVATTIPPQENPNPKVLPISSKCESSIRRARPRPRPLSQALRTTFEGEGPINLRQIFDRILIQQIAIENWTRKHLVLVGNQQPLEKALSRINGHNIHSLPVLDENSKSVIGLLDVMDILRLFYSVFKNITGNRPNEARWTILPTKIKELMKTEHRRPTYIISTQSTLIDGIRHLPQVERRRIMIVGRPLPGVEEQQTPEDTVIGLLAPYDILRFLAQNVMWMKQEKIFQMTLGELGLGRRTPHIVSNSIQAWQGFVEIYEKCTDSVAVVDENGMFVANLNASDIRGITRRNFQVLFRSLSDFLVRDQNRGWWTLPICVQDDDKLENVILQFVATKVQHMYILDPDQHPIGEVTQTDILNQILTL